MKNPSGRTQQGGPRSASVREQQTRFQGPGMSSPERFQCLNWGPRESLGKFPLCSWGAGELRGPWGKGRSGCFQLSQHPKSRVNDPGGDRYVVPEDWRSFLSFRSDEVFPNLSVKGQLSGVPVQLPTSAGSRTQGGSLDTTGAPEKGPPCTAPTGIQGTQAPGHPLGA